MEANELRCGNYITDCLNNIRVVHGIRLSINKIETDKIDEDIDMIKPIPLTEEWLLKFGFEKQLTDYCIKIDCGWIFIDTQENWLAVTNSLSEFKSGEYYENACNTLKHVHQLQNLYFALTGKELKYN